MKRIMTVVGTRPEAIKLCPLIRALRAREACEVQVLATGQHRELLDAALAAFSVEATHRLPPIRSERSTGELTGALVGGIEQILLREHPDAVLVQGDTASAFAGALAAFYTSIPVGHVEAGLRTNRVREPFPEELHRRAIALLADWHFAPTPRAEQALLREGIDPARVFVTGNTVVDALHYTLSLPVREEWNLPVGRRLLLFTAHRRESLGEPLRGMLRALRRIAKAHPELLIVFPMHPNPAIRREAAELLQGIPGICPIEPPEVIGFHRLLRRADLVLTDSGGIQEECTALGVPTVVMRYSSERTEGMRAGCLRLAGSGEEGIVSLVLRLLEDDSPEYRAMRRPSDVFGDGHAAERIAELLLRRLIPVHRGSSGGA